MTQVYLTAPLPAVATELLEQAGITYESFAGPGLITKAELLAHVAEIEVLITPLSTQVDEEVIAAAPKLKLIANFGAGFNNIDVQAARARGIDVTNTPFVSSVSTAEVACGLMVALAHQLAGKTLGIVGLGDIGKNVAQRMQAFDMKIVYTQRHRADPATEAHYHAQYVSLEELLQVSDVVSLHCPLTPATHHLLGAAAFKRMKKSALLINCARGPVLDEAALLTALQTGELAGAALDVYEKEPLVAEGFKQLTNVILTPHVGNATVEARDDMAKIVTNNALAVLAGKAPRYVVNAAE